MTTKSRIVPVRLNVETVKELQKRARKHKLKLGTYLREHLESFAPGRPRRIKNLIY